jgi:hypothetical protein
VLEEVLVYHNSEFIFHGFLEKVVTDEGAASTTLSGTGVAKELKDRETDVSYSTIPTWEAIRDFYQTHLGWWATNVIEPEAGAGETVTLQDASTASELESAVGSIPETSPHTIDEANNQIDTLQTAWLRDVKGTSDNFGNPPEEHPSANDGYMGLLFGGSTYYEWQWSFSNDYTIPDGSLLVGLRAAPIYFDWEDAADGFGGWAELSELNIEVDGEPGITFGTFSTFYTPQGGLLDYPDHVTNPSGTDETAEAKDTSSDDMTLMAASPSVGDSYTWANDGAFDEVNLDISTPGAGTYTITWEYAFTEYNDSGDEVAEGWREIPQVSDGTNGFRQSGSVTWDLEEIAQDTQAGGSYVAMEDTNDSKVRARVTSFSSLDTQPLGQRGLIRTGKPIEHTGTVSGALEPGSHTLKADIVGDTANTWRLDYCFALDDRFNYTLFEHSDLDTTTPGPQPYPDEADLLFTESKTNLNITDAMIDVTGPDVSGGFALATTIDAGGSWQETQNSTSHSASYPDTASKTVRGRLTTGRYGTQATSPTEGVNGQSIDSWQLSIIGNQLSVIESQEFSGNFLKILQEMHDFGGMRFTVQHQPDGSRQIESYAAGQVEKPRNWEVENRKREVDASTYKNRVVVKGAVDESTGNRYSATAQTQAAIDALGEYSLRVTEPDLTTADDCQAKADTLLAERLEAGGLTGSHEIPPQLVEPGYLYPIEEWGTSLSLEKVSYQESFGSASGSLDFVGAQELAEEITGLKSTTETLTDVS